MDKDIYYQSIEQSANYILKQVSGRSPKVAIMMGTGLSSIVDDLTDTVSINYKTIPHFPQSTVQSHRGKLVYGKLDETGLNKGLGRLASGAEVNAYFDSVMRERFLPSGRVRYFPMSDYEGEGRFRCLLSGKYFAVQGRTTS